MVETYETAEDIDHLLTKAKDALRSFEDRVDYRRLLLRLRTSSPAHPVLLLRYLFGGLALICLMAGLLVLAVPFLSPDVARTLAKFESVIPYVPDGVPALPAVLGVLAACMIVGWAMLTGAALAIGREAQMLPWEQKQHQQLVNEVTRLTTQRAVLERIRSTPAGTRPRIATPVPVSLRSHSPSGASGYTGYTGGFNRTPTPSYAPRSENTAATPSMAGTPYGVGSAPASSQGATPGGFGRATYAAPALGSTPAPTMRQPSAIPSSDPPTGSVLANLGASNRASPPGAGRFSSVPQAPTNPTPSVAPRAPEEPTAPEPAPAAQAPVVAAAPTFAEAPSNGVSGAPHMEPASPPSPPPAPAQQASSVRSGPTITPHEVPSQRIPPVAPLPRPSADSLGGVRLGTAHSGPPAATPPAAKRRSALPPPLRQQAPPPLAQDMQRSALPPPPEPVGELVEDDATEDFDSKQLLRAEVMIEDGPSNPGPPPELLGGAGILARARAGVQGGRETPYGSAGRIRPVSHAQDHQVAETSPGVIFGTPPPLTREADPLSAESLPTEIPMDEMVGIDDMEDDSPTVLANVVPTSDRLPPSWDAIPDRWLQEALTKSENLVRNFPVQAHIAYSQEPNLPFTLVISKATPAMAVRAMVNFVEFLAGIYTPPRARIELIDVAHLDRSFHRNVEAALEPYFSNNVVVEPNPGKVDIRFTDPDPGWGQYPLLPMR